MAALRILRDGSNVLPIPSMMPMAIITLENRDSSLTLFLKQQTITYKQMMKKDDYLTFDKEQLTSCNRSEILMSEMVFPYKLVLLTISPISW